MKIALAVASTAAIAGLAVGGAQGAASSGDSLVGFAKRPVFGGTVPIHIRVKAHSGPSGERPVGTFSADGVVGGVAFPFAGNVTCLRVVGNRAVAGGVVTTSEASNAPVGSGVTIQVTDNGFPGAGSDTNINFVGYDGSDPALTTCPSIGDFGEATITKGDFAVHDG